MGTINHDSLSIVCREEEDAAFIKELWKDYCDLAEHRTRGLMHEHPIPVNGGIMLHFGSSGSKSGWESADSLRDQYRSMVHHMRKRNGEQFRYEFCWVQFGDETTKIVEST